MNESTIFYADPAAPASAGKMLLLARERWGLSSEEVASKLNLGVAVIVALERDQYNLLPGYTFVKGYMRAYAVLLQLNPDKVLEKIDLKPEFPVITKFKNMRRIKHTAYQRTNRPTRKSGRLLFKTALVIILLAGVALFGFNQLSHLDTEKLAVLLKLPIATKSTSVADATNEVILPMENPDS